MSATTERLSVGDLSVVPPKVCPDCGARGEWPGRLCADCKPPANTSTLVPDAPDRTSTLVRGTVLTPAEVRLAELARIANEEHRQTISKGLEMLEHAMRCGAALNEAREQVERGSWLDWMERNVEIHPTTAYRYMRVATHAAIVRKSNVQSIERAMQVLADLPRHGHGPRGYTDADKRDWIKLVDQVGVKRAAKALGVSVSTVWKWAGPNSPDRAKPGKLDKPLEFSEEMVELLARWLVARFADHGYFVRVTPEVRKDARQALLCAFGEASGRGERPLEEALLDAAGVDSL